MEKVRLFTVRVKEVVAVRKVPAADAVKAVDQEAAVPKVNMDQVPVAAEAPGVEVEAAVLLPL